MIFGYARVSTRDQNLDLQTDALKKAGCKEVYAEKLSGTKVFKPELETLLSKLRNDDTLIVYSLDRLGRTSKQLINLLSDFKDQGVHFRSLQEGMFDTTTPMGTAIFQIIAILKAMEVQVLSERTRDGLAAARARGKKGGRPKGSYNREKAAAAASFYQKEWSVTKITSTLKISRSTLYEYLRREGVK